MGVASTVSQYNIWDEYLTQISGLTACFLRDDLATQPHYAKLQAMYAQSVGDVQRILFGTDGELLELFPGASLDDIKKTAHYYHAPAMGKCFPQLRASNTCPVPWPARERLRADREHPHPGR